MSLTTINLVQHAHLVLADAAARELQQLLAEQNRRPLTSDEWLLASELAAEVADQLTAVAAAADTQRSADSWARLAELVSFGVFRCEVQAASTAGVSQAVAA